MLQLVLDLTNLFHCLELICIYYYVVDNWFTVDEKPPIAHAKVEIMEGADMKPSDPNGMFSTPRLTQHFFQENATTYLDDSLKCSLN